jgi:hypothetical protein
MKFLYTYACLILLFSTTGNCGDLPQTNEALKSLYQDENNNLTEAKVSSFLKEAIRLGNIDMIKTIMNPPKDINPKPDQATLNEVFMEVLTKHSSTNAIICEILLLQDTKPDQATINKRSVQVF